MSYILDGMTPQEIEQLRKRYIDEQIKQAKEIYLDNHPEVSDLNVHIERINEYHTNVTFTPKYQLTGIKLIATVNQKDDDV